MTSDFYSTQIILRSENSAGVEKHPKPRAGFFHKQHSMLCTNFLTRRAAHARALSWHKFLERLVAASHRASAQGTVCHQPLCCRVLVAQKTEQQGKEGCLWATNARSWYLQPALQCSLAANPHSEFANATIFPLSLITLTTSVSGRHLPLPKAIAQRKFFPLQNPGLKADAAKFPPSQIKMISH